MHDYLMWPFVVLSLIGTIANLYKKRWCFHLWSITNAAWVIYDFSIGAYSQGCLMFTYLLLAILGIWLWKGENE